MKRVTVIMQVNNVYRYLVYGLVKKRARRLEFIEDFKIAEDLQNWKTHNSQITWTLDLKFLIKQSCPMYFVKLYEEVKWRYDPTFLSLKKLYLIYSFIYCLTVSFHDWNYRIHRASELTRSSQLETLWQHLYTFHVLYLYTVMNGQGEWNEMLPLRLYTCGQLSYSRVRLKSVLSPWMELSRNQ